MGPYYYTLVTDISMKELARTDIGIRKKNSGSGCCIRIGDVETLITQARKVFSIWTIRVRAYAAANATHPCIYILDRCGLHIGLSDD